MPGAPTASSPTYRSGFATLLGRPNVGKSTLVNRLVGRKVSIVSRHPQTTRSAIRGVRTSVTAQMVFVDTPGIHKPRSLLGERGNQRAFAALHEVDVICLVVEANAPIGRGDRFVADRVAGVETPTVLVLNKVDAATPAGIVEHLDVAQGLGEFAAFVPVSALTGDGVDLLAAEIEARLPAGPRYYPEEMVTDQPETFLAAELVREQLLAIVRDELPHSIAVSVEVDEDRSRDELLVLDVVVSVERDSQKGIVIGRDGAVLKIVGTAARRELEALLGVRVHLEIQVRVAPRWPREARLLDRLGL